jgi:hypothetical protein
MFLVQRALPGVPANWKTICTDARESYAREVYERQLTVNNTGRFRLLNPAGVVLAEGKPKPLFERRDDQEQRLPTYYAPPEAKPGKT